MKIKQNQNKILFRDKSLKINSFEHMTVKIRHENRLFSLDDYESKVFQHVNLVLLSIQYVLCYTFIHTICTELSAHDQSFLKM